MKCRDIIKEAKEKGYSVTDSGEVLSPFGRLLKLGIDTNGYLKFSLRVNNNRETLNVHRFVAYLKFGSIALYNETRHFDNNKLNNSWDNIKTGTHRDNMLDIPISDRIKTAKFAASYLRKLTYKQANQLRTDRKNGLTYVELMSKYNITKSTISYIVNNKTYRV